MNFLLEIGCEEIPAQTVGGLAEALAVNVSLHLGGADVSVDWTPRRLVVGATGVPEREDDTPHTIAGPSCLANEAAVAGFARKHGVPVDRLDRLAGPKGEYYAVRKTIQGRGTKDVLAGVLENCVLDLPIPKTMYWLGKGGVRFIRPIRWIVALLGDEVIPFEIAGIRAGNESSGHRVLGASRFAVTYDTFEQRLRKNFVILSRDERRDRIRAVPTRYKCDNELLNTLVNLTEWPTPITGNFDAQFLDLPKEVLTTVMRVHQRYFSVETEDGKLAPQFVAVTNTDGDPDGLILHGNETVLRARFNDARFFWNADQKKPLSERVKDLASVMFQAKLGTYLEKTERITELVKKLGGDPGTERAAHLCKADLTTELVKEFTELQGIIGGLYARAQGEPEEVWTAIYDHYRPASMEDAIPRTVAGQLVSIADKLDTLRGCFRVGLIPTGTRDPFALRRATQGIVRIVVEGKLRLSIRSLLEGDAALEEFFLDRVRYYFREIKGFAYDEINGGIASGWDDLVDLEERLAAVRSVRSTENFEPVAALFKRIKNILKQAAFKPDGTTVDPALLEPGPEQSFWEAYTATHDVLRDLAYYPLKLQAIASLRPQIDLFFDKVLVNAPDPAVRHNRLTLLYTMLAEFSTIADFSEIVTSSQESK